MVGGAIRTAFVARGDPPDRNRNAREIRKTYRSPRDWRRHEAVTDLTMSSRTSAGRRGRFGSRTIGSGGGGETPAMAVRRSHSDNLPWDDNTGTTSRPSYQDSLVH